MMTTIANSQYQTNSAFTLYKPTGNGERKVFGTYAFLSGARRAQAALKPKDRRGSVISYKVENFQDPRASDLPAPVEAPEIIEARRKAMYTEAMARVKMKAKAEAAEAALHDHDGLNG